jgi:hypothetical protein
MQQPFTLALGRPAMSETTHPYSLRFSQDSIRPCFQNGLRLDDTIEEIPDNKLSPDDFPTINVWEHSDGHMYALDNRRLFVFQNAGVSEIMITKRSEETV